MQRKDTQTKEVQKMKDNKTKLGLRIIYTNIDRLILNVGVGRLH